MARICDVSAKEQRSYARWCKKRPPVVRELAERFPPWELFRMKSTGHRCTVAAIAENGTVRVDITGEFNQTLFDRSVFGVDPGDLEPCELPGPNETPGTVLTQQDVEANLESLRVVIRPDLFVMGEDGRAVRKQ